MKPAGLAATILGMTAISLAGFCYAQKLDPGMREYDGSCAVCHGKQGKGDGPYAGNLKSSIPDLTTLSKANNGIFPFQEVYAIVDGRRVLKAHGTSEMPIWGIRYLVGERYSDYLHEPEERIRARILALTEYIQRLQVK
jgi:hypothetical protein